MSLAPGNRALHILFIRRPISYTHIDPPRLKQEILCLLVFLVWFLLFSAWRPVPGGHLQRMSGCKPQSHPATQLPAPTLDNHFQ